MKAIEKNALGKALEFKAAFDRTFAEAHVIDATPTEELLAIRLGTMHCAFRLPAIAGVVSDKKVARVPARNPSLMGIASFRGAIVPVYDLHLLMGLPAAPSTRWMVILAEGRVALAFEEVVGHLRVPRDAIAREGNASARRNHIGDLVTASGGVRGIVDLHSIVAEIRKRAAGAG